jgi:hypothetical protein
VKKCTKCGELKPLSEFRKKIHKSGNVGKRSACKTCEYSRITAWRHRSSEKIRNERLRNNFGISLSEYNKMLEDQGGFCAICGGVDQNKALAVDHDHETGEIRGLLCSKCNTTLGLIHDDVVTAERIALYLSPEYRLKILFGIPVEFPAAKLARMELK